MNRRNLDLVLFVEQARALAFVRTVLAGPSPVPTLILENIRKAQNGNG